MQSDLTLARDPALADRNVGMNRRFRVYLRGRRVLDVPLHSATAKALLFANRVWRKLSPR